MDRGRSTHQSNKSVFPTHINLNLQALPAQNIPEQLRKQKRNSTQHENVAQYAQRLLINASQAAPQSRPNQRFHSRSRDSSRSRETPVQIAEAKEFLTQNRIAFLNGAGGDGGPISRPQSGRQQQRLAVSERLDLDGRNLEEVPKLSAAYHEALKLFNLQHNMIISLRGIEPLRQLVFLDLYDNRIMDMRALSQLLNLRVLMLGKNYVKKIDGLANLERLDVLDLHANLLTSTRGLEHQVNLRTLNVAGNQLKKLEIDQLVSLVELNARRNQIERVPRFHSEYLARVYLSYNSLAKWDDAWCLGDVGDLSELTLDGNLLASKSNYRQTTVVSCVRLKSLDGKRVTEEERRAAGSQLKREIEKRKQEERNQIRSERRKLAISNAARLWRSEHGEIVMASMDSKSVVGENKDAVVLAAGDSHLIEQCGETIRLFGDAIGHLENVKLGNNASGQITALSLRYCPGRALVEALGRLKSKFANLKDITFGEASLTKLTDFERLVGCGGIERVNIDCANPVTKLQFWKDYIIARCPSLIAINNVPVIPSDVARARAIFGAYFSAQLNMPLYRLEKLKNSGNNQTSKRVNEEDDLARFSVLLDECAQLSERRERVTTLARRVYMSLIRDCTAQILDHPWSDYATASSSSSS